MMISEELSLYFQTFLSEILRAVLIMSAAGSVLALILFALNSVLAKLNVEILSKAAQYRAWKIVLAVFFLPVFLLISAPVHTPFAEVQNVIEETIVPNKERYDEIMEKSNQIVMSAVDEDADAQQLDELKSQWNELRSQWWIDYLKFIPLGISIVLFGTTWIKYRVFIRKLRLARLPARNEEKVILLNLSLNKDAPALYRNPLVPTAMLAGVFDPTIYLPDCDYSETQLENILLHELTHYRRYDVLVKWFSTWLTQLHWFNPLAYLVRRELNRVCELSCDEAAIDGFDDQKKQEYGDTLISVAAGPKISNSMISTALCEEKKNLKDRLTAIMNSRKITRGAMVFSNIFVALTLCITVVFAAAPDIKWIDRSSVTSATRMRASSDIDYNSPSMYEFVPFDSAFPNLYEDIVLSEADTNMLIRMINLCPKTAYTPGTVQPVTYRLSTWMQINCEDGGYYLLNYWYWKSFSFNPLHPGEDDYCSLLTYFDASGNIGPTWKMAYYFDGAFSSWAGGVSDRARSQMPAELEEENAAESNAKTWKAVVNLDDYYSVEEVSAWIEEYGITVNRVHMWPAGETGRLSLLVENGNIQDAIEDFMRQTGDEGIMQNDEQFRKDYERLLNEEYKIFALTVISPDGTFSLLKQLKTLTWDIGCVSYVNFMDSGNSREIPVKPDGAL